MIAYINASFDLSIVLASFCYPKFQIIISRTFKTERHILIRPLFLNRFISNTLWISKKRFYTTVRLFFLHFFLLLKIYGYQKLLKDMLLVLMYDMTLYERIKVVTELFFFFQALIVLCLAANNTFTITSRFSCTRDHTLMLMAFLVGQKNALFTSVFQCAHIRLLFDNKIRLPKHLF